MTNDGDQGNGYAISADLAAAAWEADRQLTKATQAIEGGFLVQKEIAVIRAFRPEGGHFDITAKDLIATLAVEKGRAFDSADGRHKPSGPPPFPAPDDEKGIARNVSRFINLFYDEIVSIICKGDKKSLGITTHAALVALSAWLAGHLSVDEKLSTPAATAILIAITRATKGAFCKMAAEDVKRAIGARQMKNQGEP